MTLEITEVPVIPSNTALVPVPASRQEGLLITRAGKLSVALTTGEVKDLGLVSMGESLDIKVSKILATGTTAQVSIKQKHPY